MDCSKGANPFPATTLSFVCQMYVNLTKIKFCAWRDPPVKPKKLFAFKLCRPLILRANPKNQISEKV